MRTGTAVFLGDVSKYYKLYRDPGDRLKEALSLTGKVYHEKFYAIRNLDLEIRKGEIVGIVGRNGSGKSTLLKLITGVLAPDGGTVKVNGEISALLELGSGFNPEFTGMQNIYFYGTILGFTRQQMDEKIGDIVAFAEIGEFIHQPLKTYSSGMKSRLAFAVAVHIDPEILILDEILSVGDALFKRKSYAKMQEFFESGKTIVYVSHSTDEVNRLCTRAVFLHDGRIVLDGEPKTVTKYYEKFLFAKGDNRRRVLKEIRALAARGPAGEKPEAGTGDGPGGSKGADPRKSADRSDGMPVCEPSGVRSRQKAFWIPDLVSKNRIEYDRTWLKIGDIAVETLSGEKVNALLTNERYRFRYTLHFGKAFENVNYGMQIMTEKGVLVSGARPPESIDVEAGDRVRICWEFECLMHHGLYYLNIGVNRPVNGELVYINRIVDAYVFKVLPVENCCNGMVYLKQQVPEVTFLTGEENH